jgi:hypothetical protein
MTTQNTPPSKAPHPKNEVPPQHPERQALNASREHLPRNQCSWKMLWCMRMMLTTLFDTTNSFFFKIICCFCKDIDALALQAQQAS